MSICCAQCGEEFQIPMAASIEETEPCPTCGSKRRLGAEFGWPSSFKLIDPKGSKRRPLVEHSFGIDIQRSTGRRVSHERRIDRVRNIYEERIVDEESGRIIHEIAEKLSEHQGHGSAKFKRVTDEFEERAEK